jgi:UDP-N-acetylmuramyl pentapeptide phosphotransferase/UDP-N-acetylglucosamine-1-phosphate transferase
MSAWIWPAFAAVASGSYLGVALFRRLAERWDLLDYPTARSSHREPTPFGAGIVMLVINVCGWLWYAQSGHDLAVSQAYALAAGALLIATVSFRDDMRHVPYTRRLAVHGAAAVVLIGVCGYWDRIELPVAGTLMIGAAGVAVSILWIVGLTNAFNFMDGLDGLAAGQSLAAGTGWAALGLLTHHPALAFVAVLLAASSFGFLLHNWHPATIFMGDVGSTFLGYSFAALPVLAARYDPRFILAGMLLVWPVIFDSAFTVLRRIWRGEPIFSRHRTFLFHRLEQAGWKHSEAAALYMLLPLMGAFLAFTWQEGSRALHVAVVATLAALCLGLWRLVRLQELSMARRNAVGEGSLEAEPVPVGQES